MLIVAMVLGVWLFVALLVSVGMGRAIRTAERLEPLRVAPLEVAQPVLAAA